MPLGRFPGTTRLLGNGLPVETSATAHGKASPMPPAASRRTTSQGGAFQTVSRTKPTSASAKLWEPRTAPVHTGSYSAEAAPRRRLWRRSSSFPPWPRRSANVHPHRSVRAAPFNPGGVLGRLRPRFIRRTLLQSFTAAAMSVTGSQLRLHSIA